MLRRKTRQALVLRRKDWIVIAILGLALIGSIFIWVLFLTAWSPKTISTPHARTSIPIGHDPRLEVANRYTVRALPSSFLVGRNGNMMASALGERDWDSTAAHAVIESLLK